MDVGDRVFAPQTLEIDDGFDHDSFSGLSEVEDGNWWFRSRNRLIIWALQRYFPQSKNFLEIGCGTGFVLHGIRKAFPDLSLSGSDLFNEGLVYAGERLPRVSLFQMDARRIPFEDEFDVIGAFDLLAHIDEDEEAPSSDA